MCPGICIRVTPASEPQPPILAADVSCVGVQLVTPATSHRQQLLRASLARLEIEDVKSLSSRTILHPAAAPFVSAPIHYLAAPFRRCARSGPCRCITRAFDPPTRATADNLAHPLSLPGSRGHIYSFVPHPRLLSYHSHPSLIHQLSLLPPCFALRPAKRRLRPSSKALVVSRQYRPSALLHIVTKWSLSAAGLLACA